MYNNGYEQQPPFRPPPTNLPPFPPNLGPGGAGGPGPAYPPYPPPNAFARPPFPPNLPSTPQYSPMGYNNGSPLPVRPMPGQGPGQLNSPMRPPHPGLGLPPLPSTLPVPPHRQTAPGGNFIKAAKTTSVFVGNIAPGIDDSTMHELLNACGPLYELQRVSGAGGKPQKFGFAKFESPEVVMRCIRCLNGVELPDITPEGRSGRKMSALNVKVDDKTREFLDEFEQTVGRTDDDEIADAEARKRIAQIVSRIIDLHAPPPDQGMRRSGGQSPITVIVPAHLQDLREGDLPENQRVAVLDQISLFRENAARKERMKKQLEEEQELARLQTPKDYKRPVNPIEYGYSGREFAKTTPYHAPSPVGNQNQGPNQRQGGQGPHAGPARHDPQGYSKPVGFVQAKSAEAKAVSGRTDEEEEQMRQMKIARDKEGILRERERQVEHRERLRLENLNRELTHRRQQSEMEERNRRGTAEKLDYYDDDEVADRGKDWFFADRNRWRNARAQHRTREYQDDVRDRQAEQDEIKALERESEEFLKRQMEEMARMEEEQKQRGLLSEDAAPIKLDLGSKPAVASPAPAVKVEKPAPKPVITFDADEEEEVAADKRKQRTFVKLDYDEDAMASMTEADRVALRNAQLLDIKSGIPKDKRALWGVSLDWKAINEKTTKSKILGFVNNKLVEYLGEVDQDLADFIMENIAERSKPDKMVDGLEPVLAEEAAALVVQLWRLLAFESAAAKAGLQSGNMLV